MGRLHLENEPAQVWSRNVYNAWYNFGATICAGKDLGCGEREVIRLLSKWIIGEKQVSHVQEDIYE
jgi:hypothetical protein